MTEKLYYQDAYIKDFVAKVISVTPCDGGYDVVLDKTAFFPEEGGQSADTGFIGSSKVINVWEIDGAVHHLTTTDPVIGENHCIIDFDDRFEKMQCHTAEHILCGIIHRLYGFDNVGFHLGIDEVTFDVNGVLDRGQLDLVENIANDAVFTNIKIETYFPDGTELKSIEYRSKLDITEGVRLVKIGDVDTCACCAPHVGYSGEIGLIKILDFMKHRGGTRIWMVAGKRTLKDYRVKYENIKNISARLCAPQNETDTVLGEYMKDAENARALLKQSRMRIAELEACQVEATDKSAVFYLQDFSISELIAFSNTASHKIGGMTVALSGVDGDYKYVISSSALDLKELSGDINNALSGRGGGRKEMIQGSFAASLDEIKSYFAEK